jgi:hypothetical protein
MRFGWKLFLLAIITLGVAACAPRFNPERAAQGFMDKGEQKIVKAIEESKGTPEQIAKAKAVIGRHKPAIVSDIKNMFDEHREVMLVVTSGAQTNDLLAREKSLHAAQERAARSIGKMHEELASSVGPSTWASASAQLRQQAEHYFKRKD